MKKSYFKAIALILFLSISSLLFCQNVGINTTGTSPSVNAILDLNTGNSNNLGLIIPNVSLISLATFNPPIANAPAAQDAGMMIYNTNVAVGSGVGYYYWSGASWVSVSGASSLGGSGTLNYLAKWTPNGSTLGNSLIYDNGTSVGIGTNIPNASAAVDITSTTTGFLPPRMTGIQMNNILSPATGLIVFNTTTGCVEFYTGASWQNMACPCSAAPAQPGVITGTTTFCPTESGDIYSIGAVVGANSYTWVVPAGATIVSGQGTTSITVTFGSTSGIITVYATNTCGSSAASTLAVTANATPAITVQPTNPAAVCNNHGTASFSVTATGTGLTYQWQEFITSWNNIANGGVYSGVASSILTITNAPMSMNGNLYRCIVSGTCIPSVITNGLAALTVQVTSIPITLTNNQGTATGNNFQQMLVVNSSNYSAYETVGLQNVEFTTGAGATGTVLQAWIESGATTASTNTIYWVNLGANAIAANSSLTIYMNFMGSNIMSATGPTGEAPQIPGTYAQYDNGTNVFSSYTNFAGTILNGAYGETFPAGVTITINNGVTITTAGGAWGGIIYTGGYASSTIQVFDGDVTAVSGVAAGLALQTGNLASSAGLNFNFWNGSVSSGSMSGGMGGSDNPNLQFSTGIMGGAWTASATQVWYKNYASVPGTINSYVLPVTIYPSIGIYATSTGTSISYQWIRTHLYAPSGVMPAVAFGAAACP